MSRMNESDDIWVVVNIYKLCHSCKVRCKWVMCCSVLQCVSYMIYMSHSYMIGVAHWVTNCAYVCCSVLQCVSYMIYMSHSYMIGVAHWATNCAYVCCSVLQCVSYLIGVARRVTNCAYRNASCTCIREWVTILHLYGNESRTAHENESRTAHIRMRHALAWENESRSYTYVEMSHELRTWEWVTILHLYGNWVILHIWMRHDTYMNESYYIYELVILLIWMSHTIYMNESCDTYEWVILHIWMGHTNYWNES